MNSTPKPRQKNDGYTVDYSFHHEKFCVFVQMTASIRKVHQACGSKDAAEELAERLNSGEEV